MTDRLLWRVRFADGSTFDELGPDGQARGWGQAMEQPSPPDYVDLVDTTGRTLYVVACQGRRPRFVRRRRLSVSLSGGPSEKGPTVHILGWEGAWLFVFEDGSHLLSGDFNAV